MVFEPVRRTDLIAAGRDGVTVDNDLRRRRTVAPFRGVHLPAEVAANAVARFRAATLVGSGLLLSHWTAAVLLGVRWLPEPVRRSDAIVHVTAGRSYAGGHRAGLRVHWRAVPPDEVVIVHGIACTSATRTLIELIRDPSMTSRLLAVQLLDGALRDGLTTHAALLACLDRMPGQRGVARARDLVHRSRCGVDSPQETWMRLTLEDGAVGFAVDVDLRIDDADGLTLARGDLGSKQLLLWGEYDGFEWHTGREAFRADRVGDRWLQRRGWHVMRFVDEDLRHPARTCREWRQAAADAPARIAALDPTRSREIARAWLLLGLS
jgi:hypothetical protein